MDIVKRLLQNYKEYSHYFVEDVTDLAKEMNMECRKEHIPENRNATGYIYFSRAYDRYIINPSGKDGIYYNDFSEESLPQTIFISLFENIQSWEVSLPITPWRGCSSYEELKKGIISKELMEYLYVLYDGKVPEIDIYHAGKHQEYKHIPVVAKDKIL